MRRKFQDQPLSRKALTLGIAPTVCAVVLAGVMSIGATYLRARTNVRTDVSAQALIVAENISAPLTFNDHDAAAATLGAFAGRPNLDAVCVFDESGRLFESYTRQGATCGSSFDPPAVSGNPVIVQQPILLAGKHIGTVRVVGNLSAFYAWMATQSIVIVLSLLGGLGIALALTWRLRRAILDPILALARTADAVSRTRDYSHRAQRTTRDEVGGLVDSFNTMLNEIQRRDEALVVEIGERERAEQLKDSFLAAVSHELRTPLNAILGWLQLIRDKRPEADRVERALESVERNARSQARLIEDLLDISRMSKGKFQLTLGLLDLRSVVSAAIDVVTPAANSKSITPTVSLPASPCVVRGDSDRLQQLVLNLLSNAVKFTPAGGTIDVTLSENSSDRTFSIAVQDSGIGIQPEFLPHVFEHFRQGDSSMTRVHGGLGLGLAIARELTSLHGGSIAASSAGAGLGATFRVTLPQLVGVELLPAPVKVRTPARPQLPVLKGRRLLVADDDPDGLDITCATLSSAGAIVTPAASGRDAIDSWERDEFDALISDLGMPDIDGFELLRQLQSRDRHLGRPTRAIALTAYASREFGSRAIAAGFQDHIVKPFEQRTLVNAVAALFVDEQPATAESSRSASL